MRVKGRKEHEHDLTALREAAEHCPFPIAVYDDADRLVAWNPAYEADYDRAFAKLGDAARGEGVRYADFVRAQLEDVTPPELLDDVVAERCRQQEIETMVEQQTQVGDKAMLVYKYRLPSGALAGTAVEITELIEARREAESAARAKAGFLANMSHEVRTPMNGVLGVAALLAATDLNEEQRRLVEIIQSSGDALLALINEILDFSRLEAGKEDVSIAPVEVGDVVSDVIDLMRPLADQKGLSLVAEPASAVALETD
ncbi:MAG: histidine kinase dimerization/phospho-acceptor domain-containing protein, partial [Pseudomonadota bacterium]